MNDSDVLPLANSNNSGYGVLKADPLLHSSVSLHNKRQKSVKKYAQIHLRSFDVPLISPTTSSSLDTIRLESDRPYTIGRAKTTFGCDFLFDDPRVSKQHCQIFYDSIDRNIYIIDGFLLSDSTSCVVTEFRNRVICSDQSEGGGRKSVKCDGFKASLNGVFVNGVRVKRGLVRELCVGDDVCFVCCNEGKCNLQVRIGFLIVGVSFKEDVVVGLNEVQLERTSLFESTTSIGHSQGSMSSGKRNKRVFAYSGNRDIHNVNEFSRQKSTDIVWTAKFLLNECRRILRSKDPISYILQQSALSHVRKKTANACAFAVGGKVEVNNGDMVSGQEAKLCSESQRHQDFQDNIGDGDGTCVGGLNKKHIARFDSVDAIADNNSLSNAPSFGGDVNIKASRSYCPPPGKSFYLNRLQFMDHGSVSCENSISLPELLYPIENISQVFIATFTNDILWFLSYCKIPNHLPVTIACHNAERCWSLSPEKRTSVPYSDFPNLVVVFPSFPEAIAFGKDSSRQGIACHHPKLLVLQREDYVRVIITSANLVENQWNNVTNTIWWQDFPSRGVPDYPSLFVQLSDEMGQGSGSDFAAQLAGFMATLVIDVPSQAHWIIELTKYNFEGATGHLVASVPGIHSRKIPYAYHCELEPSKLKFLGSVEAFVVGLSHLFRGAADKNGAQLKKLAAFLGKSRENACGLSEVVLRRNNNVPVDVNAVSVHIPNPDHLLEGDSVQLGFLPRHVAKWVSPLWDSGFFRFSGYVYPKEALACALGGSSMRVQLILHVLQGPKFSDMMTRMQAEHVVAFCSLIASIQRCTGLWRLQEVLDQFKWPETGQSDFIYGSSSVGSVNAHFLAAFSAAAGKRSLQLIDSDESDPEWGCWSASQELRNPSIRIIYPTIERVKNACKGILPSRRILCFSERTWQQLRTADILHDAVPHPHDRIGWPMHVKVARRRFQSKMDSSSSGWVYCGSHNFSAAAWGRQISNLSKLHVCNYELGIIFTFPPTDANCSANSVGAKLDDIVLPYVVPAPKYGKTDRPATKRAMREALAELTEQEREKLLELTTSEDIVEDIQVEEEEDVEAANYVMMEKEGDKAYAELLWNQSSS